MNNYIVLLRGINVGGHKKLPMQLLRDLLTQNGYQNVRTYIQSGNVFLESNKKETLEISIHIKQLITKEFGYDVPVITLTKKEIEKCALTNPYLAIEEDFKKLHVIFLNQTPDANLIADIAGFKSGNDAFTIIDNFIFIHYPDNSRNSKLSAAFFEKKLHLKASARNWRTVLKLKELSQ